MQGHRSCHQWLYQYRHQGCDVQNPIAVAAVAADGVNSQEYLFISGSMYKVGTVNGSQQLSILDGSDKGHDRWLGGRLINNSGILDYAVGNFDGNEEGREQVIFCTCQKQNSINNYWYCIYTYKKNSSNNWDSYETGWEINKKGDAYMSLCSVDTDNDSTVVRIKSASMTFTEPEVLALLESTPYYGEVEGGDIGNSETAYGKSDGSIDGLYQSSIFK